MLTRRISVLRSIAIVATMLAAAVTAAAQQPTVANARMERHSAATGLEQAMQSVLRSEAGPAWLGYAISLPEGHRIACCFASGTPYGHCPLEATNNVFSFSSSDGESYMLEGARRLFVLFRIEGGQVQKIRNFTEDCPLDAGGLPFHWLSGVRAPQSVAYLSSFVRSGKEKGKKEDKQLRRNRTAALTAIAFHQDPAADRALVRFVAAGQPTAIREGAARRLGAYRGRRGFEVLRRLVQSDPDAKFRARVITALARSAEPEAVDAVIAVARNDKSNDVRKHAVARLGRKPGGKTLNALGAIIENDPALAVRKQAISALGRLPDDEGVPLLIRVARANKVVELRKHAVARLGRKPGGKTLNTLAAVIENDSSLEVRKQAISALGRLPDDEGVPLLIRVARANKTRELRRQALSRLARKAGSRVAETLTEAIENDPETDIQKRAVVALSRMPKGEGIPRLIRVARTHKNPAVRKHAVRYLGRSNDPRALAFLEEIVTGR